MVEQARFTADVVVLGGGPAGMCAAIAAARAGAKTILVEQGGSCGGMATQGLVGPFMTCYDRKGERMIIRGLFAEIVDRMVAKGGALHPSQVRAGTPYTSWITVGHDHVTPYEPECLKLVVDELLTEAGVQVLYHTQFLRPILSGHTLTAKVLEVFAQDRAVYDAADAFVDAGDYVTSQLAGEMCFSLPMAAAKAFWCKESGYPDAAFFGAIDPALADMPQQHVHHQMRLLRDILRQRGQRRLYLRSQRKIIETKHGNVVRHPEAQLGERLHQLNRRLIGGAEKGGGAVGQRHDFAEGLRREQRFPVMQDEIIVQLHATLCQTGPEALQPVTVYIAFVNVIAQKAYAPVSHSD